MKPLDVRQAMLRALEADLIGPFVPDDHPQGGEEILPLAPSRYYLTGFLAPKLGRKPEADDLESTNEPVAAGSQVAADDAGTEDVEAKKRVLFPASMGMSVFLPPGEGDSLVAEVSYATYKRIQVPLEQAETTSLGWKRAPRGPVLVTVPLDLATLRSVDGIPVAGSDGLVLRGELRATEMDGLDSGTRVLSLFLVNERDEQINDRDSAFVFQVKLALHYKRGFVCRPNRRGEGGNNEDEGVLALLFREHMEWAVGHNTSVEQPTVVDGKAFSLRSTQLPSYEVRRVDHVSFGNVTTRMGDLARVKQDGIRNALSALVEEYGEWIDKQRAVDLPRDTLEGTRRDLCDKADLAKKRIAEGIALLENEPDAHRAFQLACEAMRLAAFRADKMRDAPRYKNNGEPEWRLFQLAFILMSLPSVWSADHHDRKTADLIYFPTGGGKTEAYLGLIAFVLVLRRLRGRGTAHEGRGVAVLLRYTLRLLTLDQLGRAATLICALEVLRKKLPKELGNSRFTVGLWVGASTTANRVKDVHQALTDYTPGRVDSPFPLSSCPYCGTAIKIGDVKVLGADGKPSKKDFARAVAYCSDAKCEFTENKLPGLGLPVLFADDQIYREVPSFVVATVDKFAMMPWVGDAGMLFGRATHIDAQRAYGTNHDVALAATRLPEGLPPPELIVQDELHLISGPLGTMVGLYEAAIDYLCENPLAGPPRPPKVVCSTATVRRAREQVKAIFDRHMAVFPPRGIAEGENFFSKVLTDEPGRLYVGVAAPGRALRAVSVRAFASVLSAAQKYFDPKGPPDQAADPYMTLVGYFNSLRELGGMRRLVEDEVRNRVKKPEEERRPLLFVGPHPWAGNRKLEMPAELTSRESTQNVIKTKARLAAPRTSKDPEPLDVVLASSMISVGLDVDRLGLMVVTGQPKTTSEYIQATSRVGRAYPGLVLTCLNVMRPRDRSHYERFVAYHDSFYRYVEASSVTPFTAQALDRGLVGALMSMVRHALLEMEPPTGVMRLREQRARAEGLLDWLAARAEGHRDFDEEGSARLGNEIRARGKAFFDAWDRVVERAKEGSASRTYSRNDKSASEGVPLLFTAGDDPPHDDDAKYFQVPTSMRDVEPSSHVWLRYKPLDDRG